MDSIVLAVPLFFLLVTVAVLVWGYILDRRAERRDEEDRAIRAAEVRRARPPVWRGKPAKPTYIAADRELEVPPDGVTRLP